MGVVVVVDDVVSVVIDVLEFYFVVKLTLYVDLRLLLIEVEFVWWVGVQRHNHVKPNLFELSLGCVEFELGV